MESDSEHFKGKEAIEHVAEVQAQGILTSAEIHGTEMPGHLSAGADAARESAFILPLLWVIFLYLGATPQKILFFLSLFSIGLLIWKAGRSAWLGWFRLERLHRVLEQEKWEIEHHRHQEREELRVLYGAKGFEGKLLEDVLDVLMADNDRLLRVMIEEELGLSLASYEHPLKQGLGAAIGTFLSCVLCIAFYSLWPAWGILIGSTIALAYSASLSASSTGNRMIPAIVWNLGLGILALGSVFFLLQYFMISST